MENIREIRKELNTLFINIITQAGFYVSIKEDKAGYGSIYVYNYEHKGNNSKKKALMHVVYLHCINKDATLLKNINDGLLNIIRELISLNNKQQNTFKTIVELYHYNDRHQQDKDYLNDLIELFTN